MKSKLGTGWPAIVMDKAGMAYKEILLIEVRTAYFINTRSFIPIVKEGHLSIFP